LDGGDKLYLAQAKWRVTLQYPNGEAADAAYRLALRGRPDPVLDEPAEFMANAKAVFEPLLEHRVPASDT
jgi:hypothetical protein